MTIHEFKSQLKKIGFIPDATSQCKDMMVNLHFQYLINLAKNVWTVLRVSVLFFDEGQTKPYFQVQIATFDDKRFSWSTWAQNLSNAPSASKVLRYAIGEIIYKYKPKFIPI